MLYLSCCLNLIICTLCSIRSASKSSPLMLILRSIPSSLTSCRSITSQVSVETMGECVALAALPSGSQCPRFCTNLTSVHLTVLLFINWERVSEKRPFLFIYLFLTSNQKHDACHSCVRLTINH